MSETSENPRASAENGGSRSQQRDGYAALVQVIRDLRCLVWEHHSCSVMRDEHYICPVCSKPEMNAVLNSADNALRPNEKLTKDARQ